MTDILFNYDISESFIYIVGDETLAEISQKTGVPASLIIHENNLTEEVREGMALYVVKYGKAVNLLPEDFPDDSDGEIKKLNKCRLLYPFQKVILP